MVQNILINEKYLKEFSPIPLNYNLKEIHNYIKLSEQIWLEPILGRNFHQELLYQVKNNEVTEENSTALVEAIWPYLGFCIMYEALPAIAYHASEVSLTKGHSDNSDAIDLKELAYYQEHLRRQIEARKDFLKKWICEHIDSFPLAVPCNCGCSTCNDNAHLNRPNPWAQLWTTYRKNTNLK